MLALRTRRSSRRPAAPGPRACVPPPPSGTGRGPLLREARPGVARAAEGFRLLPVAGSASRAFPQRLTPSPRGMSSNIFLLRTRD